MGGDMRGLIPVAVLMLSMSYAAPADWGLVGGGDEDIADIPPSVRDTYSEYRIRRTLASDPQVDGEANVRVIALGNAFLILGDVPSHALRNRVDALVLRATGVERPRKRMEAAVVRDRECARRSPAVNAKRRFNRKGAGGDCGLLRKDDDESEPTGWVYNAVLVRPDRGVAERAADQLLRARVTAALVGRGFEQAMDARRLRFDAQNGIVYILRSAGMREIERMAEAARGLDGVEQVLVYPEQGKGGSRL